jgi:DNA polymerase III gamma/tau subunit
VIVAEPLTEKYRPCSLADVLGQPAAVAALSGRTASSSLLAA